MEWWTSDGGNKGSRLEDEGDDEKAEGADREVEGEEEGNRSPSTG